jgi:hypothetical protein
MINMQQHVAVVSYLSFGKITYVQEVRRPLRSRVLAILAGIRVRNSIAAVQAQGASNAGFDTFLSFEVLAAEMPASSRVLWLARPQHTRCSAMEQT